MAINLNHDFHYEVCLYFAETFFTSPGKRVLDVSIQGVTVLEDYDIFADAGGADIGVRKCFGGWEQLSPITIEFHRKIQNPKISAIEITTKEK